MKKIALIAASLLALSGNVLAQETAAAGAGGAGAGGGAAGVAAGVAAGAAAAGAVVGIAANQNNDSVTGGTSTTTSTAQ
jgi:hypothetical protein